MNKIWTILHILLAGQFV